MRRLLVLCALLLLVLVPPAHAAGSTFDFQVTTYANNVKVLPPLVGDWQLGVARLVGAGRAAQQGTAGSIVVNADPSLPKYQKRWLKADVTTWSYSGLTYAHGAGVQHKLVLTLKVTSSSHPKEECAPSTVGFLTIVDDTGKKLANGKTADAVTLGSWKSTCNTFVMGWNNTDAGPRTKPPTGGPGGGQWADVTITKR